MLLREHVIADICTLTTLCVSLVWCAQVHGLGVGDAVGICTNEEGELVVEANTAEVRQATVRPTYGATALHHMPAPPPGKAESFSNGECVCVSIPPLVLFY